MIINKVLDEIFSRWSNIAALRALNRYAIGVSGREVARTANIAVKNCFVALNALENLGLVNRVRGGRDHLFSLNREHFLVMNGIIPLFEIEKRFSEELFSDIKRYLKGKCNSVYLFGSVARNEEQVDSDLDLCVVVDNPGQKKVIEDSIFDLKAKLYKKYFVNASLFFITAVEFQKRAIKNKPPVSDILKEGKLIFGNSFDKLVNAKTNEKNQRR